MMIGLFIVRMMKRLLLGCSIYFATRVLGYLGMVVLPELQGSNVVHGLCF